MAPLSDAQIAHLLQPYLQWEDLPVQVPEGLFKRLAVYLDLLSRWNARTNLTAVRNPEEIVERHFGESLFAGLCLHSVLSGPAEVLDLGSGAGFPGIPIQLLLPELSVTLAESQGKKAAFLREAVRAVGLQSEVWARRAEDMPDGRLFDAVTMRAVDRMQAMVTVGRSRLRKGGVLLQMVSDHVEGPEFPMPGRHGSFVRLEGMAVSSVPRGTLG